MQGSKSHGAAVSVQLEDLVNGGFPDVWLDGTCVPGQFGAGGQISGAPTAT
jgi:hypothetical protein